MSDARAAERIDCAWVDSGLGRLFVAATRRGVCFIDLNAASSSAARAALAAWVARWEPAAEIREGGRALRAIGRDLAAYACGELARIDADLDLRGTPFQRAVWDAEREIPYGETRTYADVARAIGRPNAVRAVGGATGKNPVPILVPCHRVVAAHGIGGFSGGLAHKRRLLALEGAHVPA